MTKAEASLLFIGENVEFNDGRIATVRMQDRPGEKVHLQFSDGTIGIAQWENLFLCHLIGIEQR